MTDVEFVRQLLIRSEGKTPRGFKNSLTAESRRNLIAKIKEILPRYQDAEFIQIAMELLDPADLKIIVNRWFEQGMFDNMSPEKLSKFPIEYMDRNQQYELQERRLIAAREAGVHIRRFPDPQLMIIYEFLHGIVTKLKTKTTRDIDDFLKAGCPAEKLMETNSGHVTKSLSAIMDKLEHSTSRHGIKIAPAEVRGYDWEVFGTLVEKKMATRLPKNEHTDPTFCGNNHSDKTDKHLLVSLKCDDYGVPMEWWAMVVDVIKSVDGRGSHPEPRRRVSVTSN
jgi:hypothetical protein